MGCVLWPKDDYVPLTECLVNGEIVIKEIILIIIILTITLIKRSHELWITDLTPVTLT